MSNINMAAGIIFLLAVFGLSQAQTDLCSRNGGICSYNLCSRYYVPSGSYQICPSPYQRCCVSELCMTKFGGTCQNSRYSCRGSAYFHDGYNRLCAQTSDVCCITNMPGQTTTTPPPLTQPPQIADKCKNYGGSCANQNTHTCRNGQFKLIGTSNEVLCNNWLSNNERCCLPVSKAPTAPPTTVAPKGQEHCARYGGTCVNQNQYRCVNGQFKLFGSGNEILCSAWSTNDERCCMALNTGGSGVTTPAPTRPIITTRRPVTHTNSSAEACGLQKVTLRNKRIVGGTQAERGEWPWQASIIKSTSSYGRSFMHSCGGTLISSQWVLSAAHCFQGVTSQYSLRVRVGEHSFYVDEGSENDAVISRIFVHPQYVHSQNKNDIALVKLSKPVDISGDYTRTACLPDMSDLADFYKTSECYTTGWGKTQNTGGDSNVLQEVKSTLVSQSTCYSKWGYKIDSTKVCFGNGYRGACQGDSGGPLVCKRNGVFNLVGVVSYGTKSCVERYVPTVYTSVAAYKKWIEQVMASY